MVIHLYCAASMCVCVCEEECEQVSVFLPDSSDFSQTTNSKTNYFNYFLSVTPQNDTFLPMQCRISKYFFKKYIEFEHKVLKYKTSISSIQINGLALVYYNRQKLFVCDIK